MIKGACAKNEGRREETGKGGGGARRLFSNRKGPAMAGVRAAFTSQGRVRAHGAGADRRKK